MRQSRLYCDYLGEVIATETVLLFNLVYPRVMSKHVTSHTDLEQVKLFLTTEHICNYWPDRIARNLVFDPMSPALAEIYTQALNWGFRRSGDVIYRPRCNQCQLCTSVRIVVSDFQPDKTQRKCLRKNQDTDIRIVAPANTPEYFDLYLRYQKSRHRDGGMDDHTAVEFEQFLIGQWVNSRFIEIRLKASRQLIAVAVTDMTDDGLSAVYTFYDPDFAQRSLGTYAILQQIEWARRDQYRYLYLGYWIPQHPKMDYKRRFHALELYNGKEWMRTYPVAETSD